MCIQSILQINKIEHDTAVMEDGRIVRLGGEIIVKPGDFLEVYADIAFAKIEKNDAAVIQKSRMNTGE